MLLLSLIEVHKPGRSWHTGAGTLHFKSISWWLHPQLFLSLSKNRHFHRCKLLHCSDSVYFIFSHRLFLLLDFFLLFFLTLPLFCFRILLSVLDLLQLLMLSRCLTIPSTITAPTAGLSHVSTACTNNNKMMKVKEGHWYVISCSFQVCSYMFTFNIRCDLWDNCLNSFRVSQPHTHPSHSSTHESINPVNNSSACVCVWLCCYQEVEILNGKKDKKKKN